LLLILIFVFWCYTYFPDRKVELYLSGLGILVTLILNGIVVSYFMLKERKLNDQFSMWSSKHKLSTLLVSLCSLTNTKHTCVLNSEMLCLAMFQAPLSSHCFYWLQFLAIITMCCCEIPCLVSQVRMIKYLGQVDNDATIGIVFNSVSLFFGFMLCYVTGILVSAPSPEGFNNNAPMREAEKSIEIELDNQREGVEDAVQVDGVEGIDDPSLKYGNIKGSPSFIGEGNGHHRNLSIGDEHYVI